MTRAKRQQERAVVLAQKNQVARAPRRKEAIKEIRRLFDEKNYEGVARALLPDVVVDKSFEVATIILMHHLLRAALSILSVR